MFKGVTWRESCAKTSGEGTGWMNVEVIYCGYGAVTQITKAIEVKSLDTSDRYSLLILRVIAQFISSHPFRHRLPSS